MTPYPIINRITVKLDFDNNPLTVGTLATRNNKIYFEYDLSFLRSGLEISPVKMALSSGLHTFDPHLFEGLPGVFDDSLPDGWGRLLVDRFLRSQGLLSGDFSPLDRLALVGTTGLGALTYEPDKSESTDDQLTNLDQLAEQATEVLQGQADEVIPNLLDLNGSSAGARPKALIGVDANKKQIIHGRNDLPASYEHWMVKFGNTYDGIDAGAIEYVYSLMARKAGIDMMDTYLFPSQKGAGYFATKRFDRSGKQRKHLHTACGLLHADFRTPSLDYENLIVLTGALTKDVREVEKMYRLAVFNVLSHNRDDHGKNFSYLMDAQGEWKLSPAYDLTFSTGPRGEQSTMVMGEGKSLTKKHLLLLAKEAQITQKKAEAIITLDNPE